MTSEILSGQLNSDSRIATISDAAKLAYDVLVVGGGIVGTGIARDASMRGMSVVLIEECDLSSGTSSKSSRLIHGGLRYLDTYDFGLVYKDLREREKLLRIAPHLVRPLKFVLPYYEQSQFQRFRLRIGMVLYDLLSMGKTLPSHQILSSDQLIQVEPSLRKEGLRGGAVFYDCQASFVERLSIENAISATENGANIFTHVRVIGFGSRRNSAGIVQVEDVLSKEKFDFRARCVVNATGPWADLTIHTLLKESSLNRLRTTKGIHLVVPRRNQNAIILYSKSDNRLFFVIPWLNYSLVGTTDTNYLDDPGKVRPDISDMEYLLREAAVAIPGISEDDILFTYAGVRPLVQSSPGRKESAVSRNYRIIDHFSRNNSSALISVLGVKITSYRKASEDVTDLISRKLKCARKCSTDSEPLPGGKGIADYDEFANIYSEKLRKYGLDENQISHLLEIYGSRIVELMDIIDKEETLMKRICPKNPDLEAQVVLSVKNEFAFSVSDFMMRRVPIAFSVCRGLDCAETVARSMGRLLNWNEESIRLQVDSYKMEVEERLPSIPVPKSASV